MIDSPEHRNKRSFGRRLAAVLAALLFVTGAFAQDQEAVILSVDGRTETLGGFNDRFEVAIRGLVASMGLPMSDDLRAQLDDLKPEYLTQLASDFALLNEAEAQGITVSDEDVDELVASSISGIPEEDLQEVLTSAGFNSVEHLAAMVRETEVIQRYLDSLFAEMEFTDEELQVWWEANAAQFATGEQVCAAHILVDDVELANHLMSELEAGADFAELAVEHSTDPGSGRAGGDLGCFGRNMMVAPFEEAAFAAEAGELVGPVESQFGQHIILVNSKIPAGEPDFEEYREQAEVGVANERIADIIAALVEVAEIESHPELLTGDEAPVTDESGTEEAAPVTDEPAAEEEQQEEQSEE